MSQDEKKITDTSLVIYTDGACSGNPGPGGWGTIVLLPGSHVVELGSGEISTTNNQMELTAVIEGLSYINQKVNSGEVEKVFIFTDSVYVIRGITQWIFGWMRSGWKNKEGQDIANQAHWLRLHKIVSELKTKKISLDWNYIRGHQGDKGNERCDQIAVAFSKKYSIDLFQGSHSSYFFNLRVFPNTEPLPEMKSKVPSDPNKKSWYVVLNGTQKLTFTTWSQCEAAVKGRSGVKFKKVSSDDEEKKILDQWGFKG
jgi:ribonuclease HI